MKSGEKLRLETLRTLRAALMEKEIEKRGGGPGMTADDEIGVLTTAAKRRKESMSSIRNGGRPELADQEEQELVHHPGILAEAVERRKRSVLVIREAIGKPGRRPAPISQRSCRW